MLYRMDFEAAGPSGGKGRKRAAPSLLEVLIDPPYCDAAAADQGLDALEFLDLEADAASASEVLRELPDVGDRRAIGAVEVLRSAIRETAAVRNAADLAALVASLRERRAEAERSAALVAAEFARDSLLRQDAHCAQTAAAALQDLAAAVSSVVSRLSAPVMSGAAGFVPVRRVLQLHGTHLSADAIFLIDGAELPFRMLADRHGHHLPEIVLEDDDSKFARILQLSMHPATLEAEDLSDYARWFHAPGMHRFTIINPNGRRSGIPFEVRSFVKTQRPEANIPSRHG